MARGCPVPILASVHFKPDGLVVKDKPFGFAAHVLEGTLARATVNDVEQSIDRRERT